MTSASDSCRRIGDGCEIGVQPHLELVLLDVIVGIDPLGIQSRQVKLDQLGSRALQGNHCGSDHAVHLLVHGTAPEQCLQESHAGAA